MATTRHSSPDRDARPTPMENPTWRTTPRPVAPSRRTHTAPYLDLYQATAAAQTRLPPSGHMRTLPTHPWPSPRFGRPRHPDVVPQRMHRHTCPSRHTNTDTPLLAGR